MKKLEINVDFWYTHFNVIKLGVKNKVKKEKNTKEKNNKNKPNNKKEKKKIGPIRIILRIILILLLVAIIAYGARFAYIYFTYKEENFDPLSAAALGIDPEKLKTIGRLNVLVLGESGVGDGYNLTDSIMLVSYNPQTQQASILSIPRDTYVGKRDKNSASPNYLASYKMNAVYRNGENIPETVERVSDLTGIKIDNYILVDTDAIIDIVDAIGGVVFDVPIDMDYDDDSQDLYIHLKAGEQLITGEKAEQLLRFRHNNDMTSYPKEYGDNDLGRMRTQREFIKATLKQLVRFENVTKFLDVFNIVFSNIRTDLSIQEAKYYIPYAFKFNMENIKSDFVPGTPEKVNGIWIYTADKKETKKVVDELFTDIVVEDQEGIMTNEVDNTKAVDNTSSSTAKNTNTTSLKIELLNGTESDDNLEKAKEKLEKEGYTVVKKGKTSLTTTSIIINRTMKSNTIVEEIKDILGVKQSNNSSNNSNVDFTIIIGKDFK